MCARTLPPRAIVRRCSLISIVPSTCPSMVSGSRLWMSPLITTVGPITAFPAAGTAPNEDAAADMIYSSRFRGLSLNLQETYRLRRDHALDADRALYLLTAQRDTRTPL